MKVFPVLGGHTALIGSLLRTLGTASRLSFFLVCLTLENGTYRLSHNFCNYQSTHRNITENLNFTLFVKGVQRQPEVQGAARGSASSEWRNLVMWLLSYLLCGDTSHFDFGFWPDPRRWLSAGSNVSPFSYVTTHWFEGTTGQLRTQTAALAVQMSPLLHCISTSH